MSRLPARLLTLALAAAKSLVRRAPYAGRPVRRILVAHYLLLGDTLLLAPLLAKLAACHPEAERIVLARPAVAPLFTGKPYGFRALAYDPRDFGSFRKLLGEGPFDLAYVLGDNRYAWLARAAGARWIVGFERDRPAWKNWMVDVLRPHSAVPTAWADMATELVSGPAPAPYRPGDWPMPGGRQLTLPSAPYVVFHVGASSALKRWPTERWQALAERMSACGLTPIWSAGKGEESLVTAIDPDGRYPRYCGTLTLACLWHLLAGAQLLISPDTGVAHLGKVVGVPTLTLYGPGSASIYGKGKFWRDARYVGLSEDPFPCRDQKLLFRREIDWVRRCGRDRAACAVASVSLPTIPPTAPCMHAIGLAAVWAACRELLPCLSEDVSPHQAKI